VSVQDLRAKARQLLETGAVAVVIGHAPGSGGRRRPLFARTTAEAETLVHDDGCWQNLATYLVRPEVRRMGRAAVVARPAVLRSVLRLADEKQVLDGDVLVLAPAEGSWHVLPSLAAMQEHAAALTDALYPATEQELARLAALPLAERQAYWAEELSRCLKCYACRAACPMCYCERCTMDCNRPQWVPVASHALGNLEYHLVRAMHLAGRCVQCAACGQACPVGIPVHLLATAAEQSVRRHFASPAGTGGTAYALSTFRPDDQEAFIR
jgi:formate dehydrogenase subunit beta